MDCIGASGFDAHSCPAQCRLATTAKLKAHAQLPNSTFKLSSHTHPPNHSFRLRCTRAGRATGVLGSHASLQQSHGWSCARRCPPTDAQLTMFQSCSCTASRLFTPSWAATSLEGAVLSAGPKGAGGDTVFCLQRCQGFRAAGWLAAHTRWRGRAGPSWLAAGLTAKTGAGVGTHRTLRRSQRPLRQEALVGQR